MKGKTIVVWFSCGAASAVAAKKTIELYGKDNVIRIVNNPIFNEHHDNERFLKDVEKWLDYKIESTSSDIYPSQDIREVFKKERIMSNRFGFAPCTHQLKKIPRQNWEKVNHFDYLVMGFTSDESSRYERFKKTERDNILNVLGDLNLSKEDCFNIINEAGILLPEIYYLGYPNANCIGCVKATSPTYWNHVRETFPDIYNERATQSREIGCKLTRHKGKRLFLDELPEDAKGHKMKSLKMPDCGIFCEERS